MKAGIESGSLDELLPTRREFLTQAAALGVATATPFQVVSKEPASHTLPNSTMKTYRIPNTDLTVSRIGYGCNQFLRSDQDPHDPDIVARTSRLVHVAVECGMNLFDMAAMYSDGKVEIVFAEILRRTPGLRGKVIIQTKCGAVDNPRSKQAGDQPFLFDCSRPRILNSVEGSLKRLNTDHVDILLLHWPDMLLQPEEVAQAFDNLHRSGKVRYFGVSNHTPGQMALLRKYVRQPLVANQILLGLASSYPIAAGIEMLEGFGPRLPRGPESLSGTFDYCRLNDIQVQAYGPVSGVVNYKLLDPPANATPEVKAASQLLLDMARQKNTTPLSLAMAWLLHHPAGILALTGASKPEHIVENCKADELVLDRDEWFKLFFTVAAVQAPKAA